MAEFGTSADEVSILLFFYWHKITWSAPSADLAQITTKSPRRHKKDSQAGNWTLLLHFSTYSGHCIISGHTHASDENQTFSPDVETVSLEVIYWSLICLITLVWSAEYAHFDWSFAVISASSRRIQRGPNLRSKWYIIRIIYALRSRGKVIIWPNLRLRLTSSVWNFSAQNADVSLGGFESRPVWGGCFRRLSGLTKSWHGPSTLMVLQRKYQEQLVA